MTSPTATGRSAGTPTRSNPTESRPTGSNPAGSEPGLRVRIHAADPVRQRGLAVIVQSAGHEVTGETPDVELFDGTDAVPAEAEAPVVALASGPIGGSLPAGVLTRDATDRQIDLALRAVAAGLLIRSPATPEVRGTFAPADDAPLLTPREREVLALIGEGLSNKSIARRLGISVHTVKFHLEALFAKLDATSRAEAVAKGLRGGVIEL